MVYFLMFFVMWSSFEMLKSTRKIEHIPAYGVFRRVERTPVYHVDHQFHFFIKNARAL